MVIRCPFFAKIPFLFDSFAVADYESLAIWNAKISLGLLDGLK